MHWCEYPSPTHNLIQAKKQQNKHRETAKQNQQSPHNLQSRVVKKVANSKNDASASQTQKHKYTRMGT